MVMTMGKFSGWSGPTIIGSLSWSCIKWWSGDRWQVTGDRCVCVCFYPFSHEGGINLPTSFTTWDDCFWEKCSQADSFPSFPEKFCQLMRLDGRLDGSKRSSHLGIHKQLNACWSCPIHTQSAPSHGAASTSRSELLVSGYNWLASRCSGSQDC